MSKFTLGPLTIGAPDRGYWRVNGKVPLDLALKLDAHPLRNRIRVAGHCCAPHPEAPWVDWFNGVGFVMSYHIDGTEAMSVFMQMCAEYGLFGSKV